jgi:hypothetical protein
MFPMAVHNFIDIAAGALLAASPWIFGFADETANVWVPHLVVGYDAATRRRNGDVLLQAIGSTVETPSLISRRSS